MPHVTKSRAIIADMIVEDTADQFMWEVLVPTEGNDGTPFSVRHHREWDAHVKKIAGGMTLFLPARGSWEDDGVDYTERMIPVRIMCTREQIVAICKETARHYDQLAILAALIGTQTVMVTNPHATNH